MSFADISRMAESQGARVLEAPEPEMGYRVLTIRKGNTAFWLYFSDDRLKQVRRGEYAPACRLDTGPTESLCGNSRTPVSRPEPSG